MSDERDQLLLDELTNDPTGQGYRDESSKDGWKATKDLLQLLGGRREITNPNPPAKVFRPPTMAEVMSLVPAAERAQITPETLIHVSQRIDEQRWDRLGMIIQWLVDRIPSAEPRDKLTLETAAKLQQRMNPAVPANQIDDPRHPATILDPETPRVTRLGLGATDTEQVNRVLLRPAHARTLEDLD